MKKKDINIAIFGGSFDPPHIGHEKIVQTVLSKINIDNLFIVPTYLNPFKSKFHLEPETRLELIKQLFKDDLKITICDFEIKQQRAVSTFETINFLQSKYNINKIYLIIGADNLKNIHLWYNFNQLKDLVEFIVISRENHITKHNDFKTLNIHLDIDISSSQLRKKMDLKYIPKKIQKKVKEIWKID